MNRFDPRLSSLIFISSIVLLIAGAVFADAASDPFVGEFVGYVDDDRYYLKINKTPDGHYQGEMTADGETILHLANTR